MAVAIVIFFSFLGFIALMMTGMYFDNGDDVKKAGWFIVFLICLAMVSLAIGGLIR